MAPTSSTASAASGPGRPTLYTEAFLARLFDAIRLDGLSDNAAAAQAGLHRSTMARWKHQHPELELRLAQAREAFRHEKLALIHAGGRGWRAAAWMLERIFPADYHPRAVERDRFQKLAQSEILSEPVSQKDGGQASLPVIHRCRLKAANSCPETLNPASPPYPPNPSPRSHPSPRCKTLPPARSSQLLNRSPLLSPCRKIPGKPAPLPVILPPRPKVTPSSPLRPRCKTLPKPAASPARPAVRWSATPTAPLLRKCPNLPKRPPEPRLTANC